MMKDTRQWAEVWTYIFLVKMGLHVLNLSPLLQLAVMIDGHGRSVPIPSSQYGLIAGRQLPSQRPHLPRGLVSGQSCVVSSCQWTRAGEAMCWWWWSHKVEDAQVFPELPLGDSYHFGEKHISFVFKPLYIFTCLLVKLTKTQSIKAVLK